MLMLSVDSAVYRSALSAFLTPNMHLCAAFYPILNTKCYI